MSAQQAANRHNGRLVATTTTTTTQATTTATPDSHNDDLMSINWTLNMRRKCCRFFGSKSSCNNDENYAYQDARKIWRQNSSHQTNYTGQEQSQEFGGDGARKFDKFESEFCAKSQIAKNHSNLPSTSTQSADSSKFQPEQSDNLSALSASSSLLSQLLNSSLNQLIEIDNGSSASPSYERPTRVGCCNFTLARSSMDLTQAQKLPSSSPSPSSSCNSESNSKKKFGFDEAEHSTSCKVDERDLLLVRSMSNCSTNLRPKQPSTGWRKWRLNNDDEVRKNKSNLNDIVKRKSQPNGINHRWMEVDANYPTLNGDSRTNADSNANSMAERPPTATTCNILTNRLSMASFKAANVKRHRLSPSSSSHTNQLLLLHRLRLNECQVDNDELQHPRAHSSSYLAEDGELELKFKKLAQEQNYQDHFIVHSMETPNLFKTANQTANLRRMECVEEANNHQQHDNLPKVATFKTTTTTTKTANGTTNTATKLMECFGQHHNIITSQTSGSDANDDDHELNPNSKQNNNSPAKQQQQSSDTNQVKVGAVQSLLSISRNSLTSTQNGSSPKTLSPSSSCSSSSCGIRVTNTDSSEDSSLDQKAQQQQQQEQQQQQQNHQEQPKEDARIEGEQTMGLVNTKQRNQVNCDDQLKQVDDLCKELGICYCGFDFSQPILSADYSSDQIINDNKDDDEINQLLSGAYDQLTKSQLLPPEVADLNGYRYFEPQNQLVCPLTTRVIINSERAQETGPAPEPIFGLDPRSLINFNPANSSGDQEQDMDQSSMVEATAKLARVVSGGESSRNSSRMSLNQQPLRRDLMVSNLDQLVGSHQPEEPIYDIPSLSPGNLSNSSQRRQVRCLSPDEKYPQQESSHRTSSATQRKCPFEASPKFPASVQLGAYRLTSSGTGKGSKCPCPNCVSGAPHYKSNNSRIVDLSNGSCIAQHGSDLLTAAAAAGRRLRRKARRGVSGGTSSCCSSCCCASCVYTSDDHQARRATLAAIKTTATSISSSSSECSTCCSSGSAATLSTVSSTVTPDSEASGPGSLTQEYLRRHRYSGWERLGRRRWRRRLHLAGRVRSSARSRGGHARGETGHSHREERASTGRNRVGSGGRHSNLRDNAIELLSVLRKPDVGSGNEPGSRRLERTTTRITSERALINGEHANSKLVANSKLTRGKAQTKTQTRVKLTDDLGRDRRRDLEHDIELLRSSKRVGVGGGRTRLIVGGIPTPIEEINLDEEDLEVGVGSRNREEDRLLGRIEIINGNGGHNYSSTSKSAADLRHSKSPIERLHGRSQVAATNLTAPEQQVGKLTGSRLRQTSQLQESGTRTKAKMKTATGDGEDEQNCEDDDCRAKQNGGNYDSRRRNSSSNHTNTTRRLELRPDSRNNDASQMQTESCQRNNHASQHHGRQNYLSTDSHHAHASRHHHHHHQQHYHPHHHPARHHHHRRRSHHHRHNARHTHRRLLTGYSNSTSRRRLGRHERHSSCRCRNHIERSNQSQNNKCHSRHNSSRFHHHSSGAHCTHRSRSHSRNRRQLVVAHNSSQQHQLHSRQRYKLIRLLKGKLNAGRRQQPTNAATAADNADLGRATDAATRLRHRKPWRGSICSNGSSRLRTSLFGQRRSNYLATMSQLRAMQKETLQSRANRRRLASRLLSLEETAPTRRLRETDKQLHKRQAHQQANEQFMNQFLVKKQLILQNSNGTQHISSSGSLLNWQLTPRCQCGHCCLVEKFIQMDAEAKRAKRMEKKQAKN